MMLKKLYLLEEDLDRVKRFLDVEVMIAALVGLLVSKGIITDDELDNAVKTVKRVSNYDFEIHEAEEDIEVFRLMMDTGAKERLRMNGLLNEDGTMKKENEECS